MEKRMNKRGAEMTIGTIVMIILALVVLVVLIYGFTVGWGNLFQNIIGFGGGKVNVQTVVQSCQVSCSTQSSYDYCQRKRNVVFEEKGTGEQLTCKQLEGKNVGLSCNMECELGTVGKGVCSGNLDNQVCESKNDKGKANCESLSICLWVYRNVITDPNIGICALKTGSTCAEFNDNQIVCEQTIGCSWASI